MTFIKYLLLAILLFPTLASAEFPLAIQKITDNVYALIGELDQRSPENHANNSTHGVIITDQGVILVDPGGSYLGAQQIDQTIKTLTDKPVKIVINSGGQDHRWLGNGYFKEQGAHIIASKEAVADHHARTNNHFNRLSELLGEEGLKGTEAVYADETFDSKKILDFGGVKLEIYHTGAAHTLGDAFIWMPSTKIMFTGDIVYVERTLGTGPADNVKSWLKVFEDMAAYKPKVIIPGHGGVTDLATAKNSTYDYLRFLRKVVGELIDDGGDMQDALNIDQSKFSYLKVFERLSKRNVQAVYSQMEFE